jgi:hypothetical protein
MTIDGSSLASQIILSGDTDSDTIGDVRVFDVANDPLLNVTLVPTRKLIEVALPLETINKESAREKSIRHGHPSTLHLWWARRLP